MSFRPLLLSCALALALAGCGVKGPLEPPPGANQTAPQAGDAQPAASGTSAQVSGAPGGPPSAPAAAAAPKKTFFLDFLL